MLHEMSNFDESKAPLQASRLDRDGAVVGARMYLADVIHFFALVEREEEQRTSNA
jgi:hypothetical protein